MVRWCPRMIGLSVALMVCLIAAPLYAQQDNTPKPYTPDEFTDELYLLRRAEIVAIGSFPLTFLFANLAFDIGRFTVRSIEAGAVDTLYAPIFFAPPGKPINTTQENIGILVGAVGLSLLIAVIDFIIISTSDEPLDVRPAFEFNSFDLPTLR